MIAIGITGFCIANWYYIFELDKEPENEAVFQAFL
jgi:hypothetical protein